MLQDRVGSLLRQLGYTLATAESLTGGLVGAQITSVPGASDYYLGGVISYATGIKNSLLEVSSYILSSRGAVSEEAAAAMAMGVERLFGASVGLSTTGVAGPTMQEGKPIGTLCISVSGPFGVHTKRLNGPDSSREIVRDWAAGEALSFLVERLESASSQSPPK
jgi:PncC family amidohydrolase